MDVEPPKRFVWEMRALGFRALANHELTPESEVRTKVLLEVTFSGLLSGVVGWVAGHLTQESIEREAAALKNRVTAR
jgi:hypothetical protein